jgi:2-phospho-L-lactate guanylyltransferase
LIFAIIPVKRFENSKSRLAPLLDLQQRMMLSGLMLDDTLAALAASRCFDKILVVTGDARAKEIASRRGAVVVWQESDAGVNSAVALADAHSSSAGAHATVVVPQDLPLMGASDIARVCALASGSPCVAVCPSLRFDGTNILLRKPPTAIATHYDNNSYENHLSAAKKAGLPAKVIESRNLMFDLDTPDDVMALARTPDEMIAAKSTASFIKSAVSGRSR